MSTQGGRDERTDWPSSKPVCTIWLLIVSVLAGISFECFHYQYDWTPLERYYLPTYAATEIAGAVRPNGWYTLLELTTRRGSELALDTAVQPVVTDGGEKTFALTDHAVKQGAMRLEWQRHPYDNRKLHAVLGTWIYQGQSFADLAKPALRSMAFVFLLGLWPVTILERKRVRELRYGKVLRGPELLSVFRFNQRHRHLRGIAFANESRSVIERILRLNKRVYIPFSKENRHFVFMGDTGSGKTQLIIQHLLQIQERKEVAIVHDPEREYTPRFYNPGQGDVILYPYDKRMPFWNIGDEVRNPAEAYAIAASLFPDRPGQDPFFWETSRKILAFMLSFKPTPERLIQWMSHPEEIDRLVEGTPYKAMIHPDSPNQRNGVLGSLNRVADALAALPSEKEGNGRWSTIEWAKKREGNLFFPSTNMTRDRLMPIYSLWLDLLVMRLQDEEASTDAEEEKPRRAWFIFDELPLLQKLPKLHDAITRNRKSNHPIILSFQGRSQLQKHYGLDAVVMLASPGSKFFLRTSEAESAKWISETIGEVEVEQLRETRTSERSPRYRQSRSTQLERRVEALVLPSEIMGLEDRRGYLKFGNAVVCLSFPYVDVPKKRPAIIERETAMPPQEPLKAIAAAAGADGSRKPNGNGARVASKTPQEYRQDKTNEQQITPRKRRFFE